MKVKVFWAGPRMERSRCGFDIIELPVMRSLKREEVVTVEVDNTKNIVMRSQHTYLGISLSDGYVVLRPDEEMPLVRIVAPYGSWIEGNLRVVEKSGKFQVKEQGVVEYKRRIYK